MQSPSPNFDAGGLLKIALEGLIGVGKTTLCNKLISEIPNECDVYRETVNEKFLELFYSNPVRRCIFCCCLHSRLLSSSSSIVFFPFLLTHTHTHTRTLVLIDAASFGAVVRSFLFFLL